MTARTPAEVHADEGGQMSVLAVLGAAAFACLLMLVINTGASTSGKIELQNAADASAVSGAAWVARGMNVISMNNVTQSQLLAIVLIVPALDRATTAARIVLRGQQIAACALSWTGVGAALCFAITYIQIPYLEWVIKPAVDAAKYAGLDRQDLSGPLWAAMVALSNVSRVVTNTFPALAQAEAIRIASENGAEAGVLVPAALSFFTLPVHPGTVSPDLCNPTRFGSRRTGDRQYTPFFGYPQNQGPLEVYADRLRPAFWPIYNSLISQFFDRFRAAAYRQLCGAAGEPITVDEPVESFAECRARGGSGVWFIVYYRSVALPARQPGFAVSSESDSRLDGVPASQQQERTCAWTPPGTPTGDGKYRLVEESVEVTGADADGRPIYGYRYFVYEYAFMGGSVPRTLTQTSGGPSGGSFSDPLPFMLGPASEPTSDGARRRLHYLAVAYRSRQVPAAAGYFVPALGRHRMAYGQTRVYNPTAYDLFTQDWRVTLEPATMLDDGALAGGLGSPGLTRFISGAGGAGLGRAIGAFTDTNVLRVFNNH